MTPTPLLPCACPFCHQGEPHIWVDELSTGEWRMICNVCRAKGPICGTEELARASFAPSNAEGELRECLELIKRTTDAFDSRFN
jgi:hypothetical protein